MINYKFRGNAILVETREIKKESKLFVPSSFAEDPEEYIFEIKYIGEEVQDFKVGDELLLISPSYMKPVVVEGKDYGLVRPADVLAVVTREESVETYTAEETMERAKDKYMAAQKMPTNMGSQLTSDFKM